MGGLGKKTIRWGIGIGVAAVCLGGCSTGKTDGKIRVELVQYKPEAVNTFEALEEKFNATHDDIELVINSPNDAHTILKTRFIRNDSPDMIGVGGDINYSNFLDADILMEISDYQGLDSIQEAYRQIAKNLEFVPKEGVYAVPYAANAAGVLYNRGMFEEHGWEIPETWDEFTTLCETIRQSGVQPLFAGYKDDWNCLAPWNAIAVDLADADICAQVNRGETTFTESYQEVAEKSYALLQYMQDDPFAYGYNDACTAFANEESAMFIIGSYAIPQILSVNPDLPIDSFVFPASNDAGRNVLNSGNDMQFSIMKDSPNKEACYEVLDFLLQDENVQLYLDGQNAVPCKKGDFRLSDQLYSMTEYIREGKLADYQDHYYPTEMSVGALIQSYLLRGDSQAFLENFDKLWVRYNRDIIKKVQDYEAEKGDRRS